MTDRLTDLLTNLLTPPDKRNLITTEATGLISLLIDVASSQDVPFRQPQQLQCTYHGTTAVFLCSSLCSIPSSTAT